MLTKKVTTTECSTSILNVGGALYGVQAIDNQNTSSSGTTSWFLNGYLGFNASLCSNVYGASNVVTPLSQNTLLCMKY